MAKGFDQTTLSRLLLSFCVGGALAGAPSALATSAEAAPGAASVGAGDGAQSESSAGDLRDAEKGEALQLATRGEVERSPSPAAPRLPEVVSAPSPAGGVSKAAAPRAAPSEPPTEARDVGWSLSPEAPTFGASPEELEAEGDARAAAPTADEAIGDARIHAVTAIQRYVAGDLPAVEQELDRALEILLQAELPEGRAGLLQLQDALPTSYADYDLVSLYTEALHATAGAVEATTDADERVEQGPGVGGPQGLGEPIQMDIDPEDDLLPEVSAPPLDDSAWISQEIARIAQAFGETEVTEHETFQREVERFIRYYQEDKRGFFNRSLARSIKYMPMVEGILAEKGVPSEMAYIAFVESGFRPTATSRASARGLWQFMPRTARAYGLKVDRDEDQRLDPYLSTIAAREYFLDLVAIFGSRSFLLAIASYNAGEGRVQGCLKALDDPFTQRTFWHIAPCLRVETQEYIPRIIAAAIIARSPERFGFTPYGTIDTPDYDILELYTPTSVGQIARWSEISVSELRNFNPDLSASDTTTPQMDAYRVVLPGGMGAVVLKEISEQAARDKRTDPQPPARLVVVGGETLPEALIEEVIVAQAPRPEEAPPRAPTPKAEAPALKAVAAKPAAAVSKAPAPSAAKAPLDTAALERTKFIRYAVQPGNTIFQIAEDFGKPTSKLLEWNPYLESREAAAGDVVHVYELDYATERHVATVKAGDTLSQIAEVYGVSSAKIARWNGIEPHRIYVGQELVVYTRGPLPTPKVEAAQIHRITYLVKAGNNLSRLSGYFGVGLEELRAQNGLSSDTIVPGQRLVIETPAPVKVVEHTVVSGESLGSISQRYNVKLTFLADTNGLRREAGLRVGQTLTIYIP